MIAAIIVAAGQGVRMGTDLRKQYIHLVGRPILARTVQVFDKCAEIDCLKLVVPKQELDFCCQQILDPIKPEKPIQLIPGGPSRQDSVYNGLQAIAETEGYVLIHDGVRPLVSAELIKACLSGARQHQACIPALPVVETLKKINAEGIIKQTIDRKQLCMAQTPQVFSLSLIKEAYNQAHANKWQATDDAALVERMGHSVKIIPGLRENIKITTPDDLLWAEAFLRLRENKKE